MIIYFGHSRFCSLTKKSRTDGEIQVLESRVSNQQGGNMRVPCPERSGEEFEGRRGNRKLQGTAEIPCPPSVAAQEYFRRQSPSINMVVPTHERTDERLLRTDAKGCRTLLPLVQPA